MTLEFIKGKKKEEDICFISTKKIISVEYPIWITKENFREIKKLMKW